MDLSTLMTILYTAPPLLLAVILHEIAHGKVAELLGDPTARNLNRINLNPLVHIDLFLTIILPAMLILSNAGFVFGGAKPVPVNPAYFKKPRQGMLWVALAGPVTNFVLAIISILIYKLLFFLLAPVTEPSGWWDFVVLLVLSWFAYSVLVNVVLGVFNLIPIPPLDGGRIINGILPEKWAYYYSRLERYGFFILIALIYYRIPQLVLGPIIKWVAKFI